MPITADKQRPPAKKSSPFGILLIVLFLAVRFVPQLMPFLRRAFTSGPGGGTTLPQLPGGGLSSVNLPLIIGGIVGAIIVLSIVRRVASSRGSSDRRLPTSAVGNAAPTMPRAPSLPGSNTPIAASYNNPQAMPNAPRYESALRGRIVLFGLVFGGLLFGGLWLGSLLGLL